MAEAAALISAIDSETREHNNWDWVGHISSEMSRSCSCTSGQGIAANDLVRVAYHKCPRSAADLIGKCALFEPLVEGNDTGGEIPNLMPGANRLRSR
jgi:hypothetical protein